MPKCVILRDYRVKAAGGPSYRAGQVVDLPAASVRHLVDRDVATDDPDRIAAAGAKPVPAPAPAPAPDPDPAPTGSPPPAPQPAAASGSKRGAGAAGDR